MKYFDGFHSLNEIALLYIEAHKKSLNNVQYLVKNRF